MFAKLRNGWIAKLLINKREFKYKWIIIFYIYYALLSSSSSKSFSEVSSYASSSSSLSGLFGSKSSSSSSESFSSSLVFLLPPSSLDKSSCSSDSEIDSSYIWVITNPTDFIKEIIFSLSFLSMAENNIFSESLVTTSMSKFLFCYLSSNL